MDRRIHSWLQYALLALICAIQAWQTYQICMIRASRFTAADGARMYEQISTINKNLTRALAQSEMNEVKIDAIVEMLRGPHGLK